MWRPFSRSYGAILPSSLAMLLPPALGSSPHPPVSVYGTGPCQAIAAFLGSRSAHFATTLRSPSVASLTHVGFPPCRLATLGRSLHSRPALCSRVPAVLLARGAGLFTCCPSGTPLSLPLGPDSPGADQLYPGNLGYSAARIPTLLSLLIPAFSLPTPPPPLPVRLRRCRNAPLPPMPRMGPWLRRRVSAPDIFGAGTLGQ